MSRAPTDRTRHCAAVNLLVLGLGCTMAATAATAQDLVRQVAELTQLDGEPRVAALTRVANALPFCDDAERDEAVAALRQLAADGSFYSPAPARPSLLWFEYERALRRSEVRTAGADPEALAETLRMLLKRRAALLPATTAFQGVQAAAPSVYDLTSFGWHGAGEVLEAVADLAERQGEAARAVGAELAKYLTCERPHPLQSHRESHAGVGEPAPADTRARQFPILWGDGYRIALARAVIATKPDGADLSAAALHLLYSPRRADRLDAIARLRMAPLTEAAVTHLVAQFDDADRLVVREAITVLGSGGPCARAARGRLRQLANGDDRELRVIAARVLQQLGDG